ncbi:hypothetical protein CSKR_111748, partial [Clonorchis sinensis]
KTESLEGMFVRTQPLRLDFPCLGLSNPAVSQPSRFLWVAWQLGTERVLTQLFISACIIPRIWKAAKIFRSPTSFGTVNCYLFYDQSPQFSSAYSLISFLQFREIHSFANQFGFCERLTGNPAQSPVFDVSRQLNVLHQAASCSSCCDIRDIAIHTGSDSSQLGARWQSADLLTERSVLRTQPLHLDFTCLGLSNLAVSQPSCFLLMAWQLGTERVLQLNDLQCMIHFTYFLRTPLTSEDGSDFTLAINASHLCNFTSSSFQACGVLPRRNR